MGSISARHARAIAENVERVLAIELLCAAQGLDFRLEPVAGPAARPGAGVHEAHARIRARIRHLDRDREPGRDIAAAVDLVHSGALVDLVASPPASQRPS